VRRNASAMIYRRAKAAGLATQIGCHTFRATGITIYLTNGGTLEKGLPPDGGWRNLSSAGERSAARLCLHQLSANASAPSLVAAMCRT
jgi:hypothetical protein